LAKVQAVFTFALAAYNLVRIPKITTTTDILSTIRKPPADVLSQLLVITPRPVPFLAIILDGQDMLIAYDGSLPRCKPCKSSRC
jgi:hypothetical protein